MNFPEIYGYRKAARREQDQSLLFLMKQLRGHLAESAVTLDLLIEHLEDDQSSSSNPKSE